MKLAFRHFIQIVLLVFMTACGGGGSDSSTPDPVDTPDPTPVPEEETQQTETSGVVTGFGSIIVNGVKYETDSAVVTSDDSDNASEQDLRVGMVVTLTGELNDDDNTGIASDIYFEAQLKGPVQGIDLASSQIFLLGLTVMFDDLTIFENIDPQLLAPNDFIEVNGFYDVNGDIYATRIEQEDGGTEIKLEGRVTDLDVAAQTFLINGITFNYSGAEFEGMTVADLQNDVFVRVTGQADGLIAGTFAVSSIELKSQFDDVTNDTELHLEGFISAFESATNFTVNGVAVTTDTETSYLFGSADDLALNVRVKIKGTFDVEGTLVADEIIFNPESTLKIETAVEAIDVTANTVTLIGAQFTLNSLTRLKDDSEQEVREFDLADVSIGDFVTVKAFRDAEGVRVVTKLEREDADAEQVSELEGPISDVLENGFAVAGITVTVGSTTKFEDNQDVELSQEAFFALLSEGVLIKAEGQVVSGELQAKKVQLEAAQGDGEAKVEFRGVIEEITQSNLVVSGKVVLISENTEYEVMGESMSSENFWQFASEGDQIKVKGLGIGTDEIEADFLDLELAGSSEAGLFTLVGIPGLANDDLQLLQHAIKFDEFTEFEGMDGEAAILQFLSLIVAGEVFEIEGVIRNEVAYASEITLSDESEDFDTVSIKGAFQQLDDVTLLVAGHHAVLNNETEFEVNDLEVSQDTFFSQITASSRVKIEGHFEFSEDSENGTITESIIVTKIENEEDDS